MRHIAIVAAGLAAVLATLSLAPDADAQIPEKINYQVMLTDDTDQPLVDQSVQLVFRIYDQEAGGTQLWTETHNTTTNAIGVVTAILGSTSPLTISFDGPLWLQVEVDGEILSPRRELTSAPYTLSATGGAGDGYSLDASDGSPVDAVYVDEDGDVHVGGVGDPRSLYVAGTGPEDAAVSLTNEPQGGSITLRSENGSLQAALESDTSTGGGAYLLLTRNDQPSPYGGIILDGNNNGTEEPRVSVGGTSRYAVLDMSVEGDDSVQLPDDSVSSSELLDEPGVGSIQTSSWATPPTGSVMTVAARTITAPAAGYVYVSATALVEFDNRTNQGHFVYLGLSELQNAFSTHAQEFYTSIPGGVYGHYYDTVTLTGIFEVAQGTRTFYLNVEKLAGAVRIGARQFNVLYFPTAHGLVDTTE